MSDNVTRRIGHIFYGGVNSRRRVYECSIICERLY